MKYQFILHDKNILGITSNQPPIPCFKPILKRREGCPRTMLTIACCYMSLWFLQPLRGCECFSQNLH